MKRSQQNVQKKQIVINSQLFRFCFLAIQIRNIWMRMAHFSFVSWCNPTLVNFFPHMKLVSDCSREELIYFWRLKEMATLNFEYIFHCAVTSVTSGSQVICRPKILSTKNLFFVLTHRMWTLENSNGVFIELYIHFTLRCLYYFSLFTQTSFSFNKYQLVDAGCSEWFSV